MFFVEQTKEQVSSISPKTLVVAIQEDATISISQPACQALRIKHTSISFCKTYFHQVYFHQAYLSPTSSTSTPNIVENKENPLVKFKPQSTPLMNLELNAFLRVVTFLQITNPDKPKPLETKYIQTTIFTLAEAELTM